ncbi:MAG: hypothetical protein KDA96_11690, partial [Planctomycetaceae bacterium]|nr:hypothetical protein [Planctomycetaceae bacterium]
GRGTLPAFKVWWRRLPSKGELQIRLDPVAGATSDSENSVADVRVEIGRRDTTELLPTFVPLEVKTTIQKFQSGSVVYHFQETWDPETLPTLEFALTSRAARRKDALRSQRLLELAEPRRR